MTVRRRRRAVSIAAGMGVGSSGVEIEDHAEGGDHTLRLRGELDMAGVPLLEAAVARVCTEGTRSVTVDLAALEFIDSTGLAAIVHISGLCSKHGYRFGILRGPSAVQRLFELTGLDGVLPFVDGAHDGDGQARGDG
jgi:anti-anti-sigma factor